MVGDVTVLSGETPAPRPTRSGPLEVMATIVGGVVVYCSDIEICGRH
jgi:hypothetical protein